MAQHKMELKEVGNLAEEINTKEASKIHPILNSPLVWDLFHILNPSPLNLLLQEWNASTKPKDMDLALWCKKTSKPTTPLQRPQGEEPSAPAQNKRPREDKEAEGDEEEGSPAPPSGSEYDDQEDGDGGGGEGGKGKKKGKGKGKGKDQEEEQEKGKGPSKPKKIKLVPEAEGVAPEVALTSEALSLLKAASLSEEDFHKICSVLHFTFSSKLFFVGGGDPEKGVSMEELPEMVPPVEELVWQGLREWGVIMEGGGKGVVSVIHFSSAQQASG